MKSAAMLCPRWDGCSVNACPLDPHPPHPLDKEPRCTMEKNVRVRIAAQFPGMIPRGGLSVREYTAAQSYARLPLPTKLMMAERGKVALAKHANQKGIR